MNATRQTGIPTPPADHLSAAPPDDDYKVSADHTATPARGEWWCTECGARITVSQTGGDSEYGHYPDCPHKIDRAHKPRWNQQIDFGGVDGE